nr:polysaccharide deacetylase [Eubacterium sp.]
MSKEAKEDYNYRAKRRKRIKQIIVVTCILLLVLPIILSVFLMIRVSQLEKKLDAVIAEKQLGVETEASTGVVKAEEKKNVVTGGAIETEPEVKRVYLTFDDGPSKETKRVLDVLKEKNVKATFFCIGREDEYSQKIYKRIVKEGHTLGMHSYSHIYQEIYGSLDGFKKDFHRISDHLNKITGVRPSIYRFPGGSSNSVVPFSIEEYASFLQEQSVVYQDWNVIAANGTTDNVSKEEMVRSVMDGVARYDTSIVLMYDSADKKMTADSLGEIIDQLQAGGYEILPLDSNVVSIHHS